MRITILLLQVTIVTATLQTALGQQCVDPCSESGKHVIMNNLQTNEYWRVYMVTYSSSYSIATQTHEGDIAILLSRNGVLHEVKNGKSSRVERGAIKRRRFLWSNASVPYDISNSFSGE